MERTPTMPTQQEIDAVAGALAGAKYAIAMTGAGISVESGIPPFRGPGGLWTKRGEPPLNGFQLFLANPEKAWQEILDRRHNDELYVALSAAAPNPGHHALAQLEAAAVLRFVITQNVDDLHRQAGQKALGEIHGNWKLLRCLGCGRRRPWETVSLERLPPLCPECGGLLKSDTVAFGEPIPADVLEQCGLEAALADLMLLVGTSASVFPAAGFAYEVRRRGGKLVEINPYESDISEHCDLCLRASAAAVLPAVASSALRLKRASAS